MVTISDIDIFQAGQDSGDFAVHLAAASRNFACGVFKNYPGAVIPNAVDDFLVGIWSGFCQNSSSGLPPARAPRYTGGQCAVQYNIHMSYHYESGGGSVDADETAQVWGPVKSVNSSIQTDSLGFCYCFEIDAFDYAGNPKIYHNARGGGGPFKVKAFKILSVEPAYGGANNCGDPPAEYPIIDIPPIGINVGPIAMSIPGGGTLTATGELVLGGLVNITPTLNITAQNPSLIGAVNLSVDLGGIHITPGDGSGASVSDIQALLNKFGNNIVKTPAAPPTTSTHDAVPPTGPPGNAGQNKNLGSLDYVTITLTTIPTSARVQFGNATSPNVLIGAGWIEFISEDIFFPRESINFATSIFKAPEGADGYAYTLSNGFLGQATSFQRKQDS